MSTAYDHLPGGEILTEGLRDLAAGVLTVNALLVLTGAPRLAGTGIEIPKSETVSGLPEHALYERLVVEHGREAYRMYCSLMRRLVSLENALDLTARRNPPLPSP